MKESKDISTELEKILRTSLMDALKAIEALNKEMEYLHNEIADLRGRLTQAEMENK